MYDLRITKSYTDSVRKFEQRPDVLAALATATAEVSQKPFNNAKLQTHAVKNCPAGTYTSYVGNRGHRLIWRLIKQVIVLLVVDEHDAAYRRAERLRLEIDDSQNIIRVYDVDPSTEQTQPYEERRQHEGALFMAWSDPDLLAMGFEDQELGVLRRLDREDELLDLESRMRPDSFGIAYNLVAYGNSHGEEAAVRSRREREADEAQDGATGFFLIDESEERSLLTALDRPETEAELVPVDARDLARALAAPIEDWMVYLDPSQRDLVERRFNGPARIRGAAGTGKTVVALHRARTAARSEGRDRVLFTTYIRSIPPVLEHIFSRFAPEERGQVEFKNVHAWALGLVGRSGRSANVDFGLLDRCWKRACDRTLITGSRLQRAGLSRQYLRDEVDWVIKGRALAGLDDYLTLQRSGRGTPLGRDLRASVWELYEEYQHEIRKAGVHDFNDVLAMAYDIVREGRLEVAYSTVIVDEAQDLTESAVRLLHAVVGDRPDGLLLVGDGQQSIYPGGFNLATLGIDVRGRAVLLKRNYRNTKQVLASAMRVVEDQEFDDGRDSLESGLRVVEVSRDGPPPVMVGFGDSDDHDLSLAADIEAAVNSGCGPGDVAILVSTNRLVDEYVGRISAIGLPTQRLDRYDGHPNARVKVGTFQRAKGLEFKRVYLPRLDSAGIGERRRHGEDDVTYAERLALLRRTLFVAMTRARDELWMGWVGEPSDLIGRLRGQT